MRFSGIAEVCLHAEKLGVEMLSLAILSLYRFETNLVELVKSNFHTFSVLSVDCEASFVPGQTSLGSRGI